MEKKEKLDPGFWIGLIITLVMLIVVIKCQATTAKYDTIQINVECISGVITQTTKTGKTRLYAVVKNETFDDLVPISESVYSYIKSCKDVGVKPRIGIKLRNNEVYSVIKIRKKIKL